MDVDKTGRDHHPFGVDGVGRGFRIEVTDSGDGVALDRDIAVVPGASRAVDDFAVGYEKVELLCAQKRRNQQKAGVPGGLSG